MRFRLRLTAWYVVVLAAILLAAGVYLPLRLRADLMAHVDHSLTARAAQISAGYQREGAGEFHDISNAALAGLPLSESGAQVLAPDARVVETSGDPVAVQPMISATEARRVLHGDPVHRTARLGPRHEPFRLLARTTSSTAGPRVLVVATSLEGIDNAVHRLLVLLLAGGPLALLAVAGSGWWLARKALRPVADLTAKAERISVDRLDERVPVPKVHDELAHLARTFNAMLDRLERGVDEQRRLVADTSHELRTPLAIMRSELDVALAAGDLSDDAVLRSTAEEVDRMTRIVDNLLTLARLDQGRLELLTRPVDLREQAETVAARLRPLAEAKGLTVEVCPGDHGGDHEGGRYTVRADRERVDQVITNLLDNAIKYTARGTIRVRVWRDGAEAGLTVTDTGRGIPAEEIDRIFRRFYRVDAARTRAVGGSGLGLAISQEIVRAHGGRIWADSEPGRGSRFSFALPASIPSS